MKSDRSVRKTNLRRSAEQSKRRIQAADAMKDNSPRSLSSFSFVPVISSSASFDLSTDEALVVRKVGSSLRCSKEQILVVSFNFFIFLLCLLVVMYNSLDLGPT